MTAILERYGLDKLSHQERLDLADILWHSVPDDYVPQEDFDLEIPEWHWEIIKERLAEADANPGQGILWSDLKKKWADEA